jgi:hypothetical protein
MLLPALVVALLAIPSLVLAADVSLTGTMVGTASTLPPAPGATCNPPGATQPSDFICDSTVDGTFTLTELGTGTYTGSVRLDWSIWTSSEPCAAATGTFTLEAGADSITSEIADTSRVCETTPATDTYSIITHGTITGGSGAFAGTTGGTFEATGFLMQTSLGEFTSAQTVVASVTLPDPVASPSPSPSSSATVSPSSSATASASSSPTASATQSAAPASTSPAAGGTLPDTSAGGSTGFVPIVLGMGALVLTSAMRRASRRPASH